MGVYSLFHENVLKVREGVYSVRGVCMHKDGIQRHQTNTVSLSKEKKIDQRVKD